METSSSKWRKRIADAKNREEEENVVEDKADQNGETEPIYHFWSGSLGKDVVQLTENQEQILLDKLGIEDFDYYVEKLADFIVEKNAKVSNHFATILKWWTEDAKV